MGVGGGPAEGGGTVERLTRAVVRAIRAAVAAAGADQVQLPDTVRDAIREELAGRTLRRSVAASRLVWT